MPSKDKKQGVFKKNNSSLRKTETYFEAVEIQKVADKKWLGFKKEGPYKHKKLGFLERKFREYEKAKSLEFQKYVSNPSKDKMSGLLKKNLQSLRKMKSLNLFKKEFRGFRKLKAFIC